MHKPSSKHARLTIIVMTRSRRDAAKGFASHTQTNAAKLSKIGLLVPIVQRIRNVETLAVARVLLNVLHPCLIAKDNCQSGLSPQL